MSSLLDSRQHSLRFIAVNQIRTKDIYLKLSKKWWPFLEKTKVDTYDSDIFNFKVLVNKLSLAVCGNKTRSQYHHLKFKPGKNSTETNFDLEMQYLVLFCWALIGLCNARPPTKHKGKIISKVTLFFAHQQQQF